MVLKPTLINYFTTGMGKYTRFNYFISNYDTIESITFTHIIITGGIKFFEVDNFKYLKFQNVRHIFLRKLVTITLN